MKSRSSRGTESRDVSSIPGYLRLEQNDLDHLTIAPVLAEVVIRA